MVLGLQISVKMGSLHRLRASNDASAEAAPGFDLCAGPNDAVVQNTTGANHSPGTDGSRPPEFRVGIDHGIRADPWPVAGAGLVNSQILLAGSEIPPFSLVYTDSPQSGSSPDHFDENRHHPQLLARWDPG